MMTRIASFVRNQRGSALIEFALVSPLVIMLTLGALEFGRLMQAHAGLRELAGRSGRDAVVSYQIISDATEGYEGYDGADLLKSKIETEAGKSKYNLGNGSLVVNVEIDDVTALPTVQRVKVSLDYNYPISLPFLVGQTVGLAVDRTYYVPHPASNPY